MNTLVVLSQSAACVQCNAVKRFLNTKGIPATVLDATTDENRELAKSLGHMQAPVCIEYDAAGNIVDSWSGFNPDRMREFIPELPVAA